MACLDSSAISRKRKRERIQKQKSTMARGLVRSRRWARLTLKEHPLDEGEQMCGNREGKGPAEQESIAGGGLDKGSSKLVCPKRRGRGTGLRCWQDQGPKQEE